MASFLNFPVGSTKPANVKRYALRPAALIALTTAEAPGTGTTRKPAFLTASTTLAPGSLTAGVPASVTRAMRSPALSLSMSFTAAEHSLCS